MAGADFARNRRLQAPTAERVAELARAVTETGFAFRTPTVYKGTPGRGCPAGGVTRERPGDTYFRCRVRCRINDYAPFDPDLIP
ncbi:hypothetical protein FDZ84_35835 [Saccharopolyspora sp. ASAGF58]|nr:hypothetical protein FDZ84_35835 [Saccharopolyspora sp. ASAGF58]